MSDLSLPKDISKKQVLTQDATLVTHGDGEEEDECDSSNRESRINSRSSSPVAPEEDGGSLRISSKRRPPKQQETKKVIPRAGAAWKGMQGDGIL